MLVHDSWWSNGSASFTIMDIDYHVQFDQGFRGRRHSVLPFGTLSLNRDLTINSRKAQEIRMKTNKLKLIKQVVYTALQHVSNSAT